MENIVLKNLKKSVPPTVKAFLRPYYRKLFPLEVPTFPSEYGVPPNMLIFNTNLKCLAVCPHCYLLQENPDVFRGSKFATDDFFTELLEAPSNRLVNGIIFSGGEALQHPKIFEWCEEAYRRGKTTQVISNGMSYSYDKIVDKLLSYGKDAPFTNLQISLDSANEADYVAAKGLKKVPYEKILNNVRRVATHYKDNPDVSVVLSFVVGSFNIDKVQSLIDMAISLNADVAHFHTLQLVSDENWKKLGDSLFVFPPQYHTIMARTDYPMVIQLQPPLEQEYMQYYCSSLTDHVTVGPDGELAPCCHRAWGKQHGNFQTSELPYNNPTFREMRRQFIDAKEHNDVSRLHESCRMCNKRLKGIFRFDPVVKKWNFQDSAML